MSAPSSAPWIDTHCHLNFADPFPDPAAAVAEAAEAGVGRMIVVGIDYDSSAAAVDLAERFEGIYAAVGIHPCSAAEFQPSDLTKFKSLITHPKCVALGEIGLDLHWHDVDLEDQTRAFISQLEWAEAAELPIILHIREAFGPAWPVLECHAASRTLDFHCFSGTSDDAARAEPFDAYFGFDGPITFPKSVETREIARKLPFERILLETDSPYLSPVPFRGKPNHPSRMPLIGACLAEVKSVSAAEAAAQTSQNALRIFSRLKPAGGVAG